jgi:hypothetical protein
MDFPPYPPSLSEDQMGYLVRSLQDWLIVHGLFSHHTPTTHTSTQKNQANPVSDITVLPVTLFPSLFPRSSFEEAMAVQRDFNELYAAISKDEEWLSMIVQEYGVTPLRNVFHPLLLIGFIWADPFLRAGLLILMILLEIYGVFT